jgi:hypothetical protein
MGTVKGRLGNERGSVIVMVAVSLFAMLALAALAIDLSSLRDTRAEAQRAADVIALSGASAFRDMPWTDAKTLDSARSRAFEVARRNKVRADTLDIRPLNAPPYTAVTGGQLNRTVPFPAFPGATMPVKVDSTNDVTIVTIADSQKVRVWVRRAGVATFFGGLLAKPYGHVQAMATAWATNAGPTVNCLKPFLIPDMWHEADKTTQDVNGNDYMEPAATANGNQSTGGEQWFYQPSAGDYYAKYDPSVQSPPRPQTGYGTSHNGYAGDVGLPILFKPQTGNNQRQGNSYFTLDGPAHNLRDDIKNSCINAAVGDNPSWSNGSQTGQAKQGIQYLINQDPGASWNPSTKQIENSAFRDWTQSPRVIIVGLMDPIYIQGNSTNVKPDQGATYNNFARLFLQDSPGNTDNLQGIFLGYAPGGTGGPTGGTLVKVLQLIQ